MNFIELLIIYLACGAPFGVYYYFQERETQTLWQKSPKLWAKSLFIMIFWLPFAFKLLKLFWIKKLSESNTSQSDIYGDSLKDSLNTINFDNFEKKFSQLFLEENTDISIFEFRETFQRFAGLTLESSNNKIHQTNLVNVNPIFEISNHENQQLATICLNRHNRLHLETHHKLARRDFLRLLEKLNSKPIDKEKLSIIAFQFAKIIDDIEFSTGISQIFEGSKQTEDSFAVNQWRMSYGVQQNTNSNISQEQL